MSDDLVTHYEGADLDLLRRAGQEVLILAALDLSYDLENGGANYPDFRDAAHRSADSRAVLVDAMRIAEGLGRPGYPVYPTSGRLTIREACLLSDGLQRVIEDAGRLLDGNATPDPSPLEVDHDDFHRARINLACRCRKLLERAVDADTLAGSWSSTGDR